MLEMIQVPFSASPLKRMFCIKMYFGKQKQAGAASQQKKKKYFLRKEKIFLAEQNTGCRLPLPKK